MYILYNLIFYFYQTPLHLAVEIGNIKIVKLLLSHPKIDLNCIYVLFLFLFHIILYRFFMMFTIQ